MNLECNNELINILYKLDDKTSEISQNIVSSVLESDDFKDELFEELFRFDSIEARPSKLKGKKGIYIFVITQDVFLSKEQVRGWNDICKGGGFKEYGPKDMKKGDVLYVGSCISESLFVRIRQHFLRETTVSSLRLGHPSRMILEDKVIVYAYSISREYKSYYRYIIPQIEKKLHNSLNPKAGSSRV